MTGAMINDIVIDQTLGYLERGERVFSQGNESLEELKWLGVVETTEEYNVVMDIYHDRVTKFNAPPSRHFLQPYRALRDLQKKLDTLRRGDGLHYAAKLLSAARLLSKRLLEMEQG